MGFITNVVNKFKFKSVQKIDGANQLSVGTFENGKLALLKNGKVVDEDLVRIATEFLGAENSSSEFFLAETDEGDYRLYDTTGDVLVISFKNPTEDFFEVKEEKGFYTVNLFDMGTIAVVPSRMFVTEKYSFIDEENEEGVRLVAKSDMYNDFQSFYYVDGSFFKVSPEFVEEQDFGDFKILSVLEGNETVDYICDPDYKNPSKKYSFIDCVNGRFFATDSDNKTYYVDRNGEAKTKPLAEYKVLNNGNVIVVEEGKTTAKLLDQDFDVISLIENPVVDEAAGIIAGTIADRYVMFGYNHKKLLDVDENVAKLIIEKLQGKRMNTQSVSYVFDNQIDMSKTVAAYELIVAENLKADPQNETLLDLSINARERFVQALDAVSAKRVSRANTRLAAMEAEKRRMETEASRLTARKGNATRFNEKVSELEEDKVEE